MAQGDVCAGASQRGGVERHLYEGAFAHAQRCRAVDRGQRLALLKTVTVEGTVRGSRGDLYKTHVTLDMDEHEGYRLRLRLPAAYRYPGMCKHAIATALAYLDASGAEAVEGLRTPVRTFTAQPGNSPRVPRPPRRPSTQLSFRRPSPRAQACGGAFRSFGRAHG